MFRDKFCLSLALTIPAVLLSPDIQEWFGYGLPSFPGSGYVAAILAGQAASSCASAKADISGRLVVGSYRRSNRHASRSYQLRSLIFDQPLSSPEVGQARALRESSRNRSLRR